MKPASFCFRSLAIGEMRGLCLRLGRSPKEVAAGVGLRQVPVLLQVDMAASARRALEFVRE